MAIVEQERPVERTVTEADVLERAADLLGEYEWIQGATVRYDDDVVTGYCALGAIGRAGADLHVLSEAAMYHRDWPLFNDKPGRTKQEVVTALREAAASLRANAR